jgi:hypothetical protein
MTSTEQLATFAATFAALYAGHHVGDYWIQTDHQARHKGAVGHEGRRACLTHVVTYVWTQALALALLMIVTGLRVGLIPFVVALLVSGVTHYAADRREYGVMFWLARKLPGKDDFLKLGVPRSLRVMAGGQSGDLMKPAPLDNPSLGTGAWALDQSWHLFWGVFVAALILAV